MRILLISSSYPRFKGDGTAPFIKSIVEELAGFGNDVEVVAPYDSMVQSNSRPNVAVHRFHYALINKWHILGHARALESDVRLNKWSYVLIPFYVIAAFIYLWKISGKQKSQIIYAHWVLPNGLPAAIAAKIRKIPLVISIHGSDAYIANKNFIFRAISKWIFKNAKFVTSCSPTLKAMAVNAGAPIDTILIPYGVDSIKFHPNSRLQNEGSPTVIVTVGRLVYKKGFEILLKAMVKVHQQFPKAKLVIGGEGPIKAELTQLAVDYGISSIISLPGRISWDEMPSFLAQSNIFVLPSIHDHAGNVDGLPNVLLEAMACGCAIIASNISGVPLVIEEGVNGLLFPAGDVDALSDALIILLSNPALQKTLGSTARKIVETELDWHHIGRRFEKILKDAI